MEAGWNGRKLLKFLDLTGKTTELFFRTKDNDPKGNSVTIRATPHFQKVGHYLDFNRLDHLYPKLWGRVTWNHEGEIYPFQNARCRTSTPVGLKGRVLNQRGLFLRLNISWSLPC